MKALAESRSVPSLLTIANWYLNRPLDEGSTLSTYLEDIPKSPPLQSRRPFKDHIGFSYPPVRITPLYSIILIHLTSGHRCLDGLSTLYQIRSWRKYWGHVKVHLICPMTYLLGGSCLTKRHVRPLMPLERAAVRTIILLLRQQQY